jgi:Spy/CpxP family protein refolding chaperone
MKKALIILVAAALALPFTAMAQGGPGGPGCTGDGPGPMHHGMQGGDHWGMRGHDGMGRMGFRDGMGVRALLRHADDINLTDQQQADLKQMAEDFKLEQIDRKAALEKAEVKLRSLMQDDKSTESEVLTQIDQVTKLKGEMQKMRYQHRQRVKSLLTEEQQTKLKELRKQRRADCPRMGDGPRGQQGGRR